MILGASVLTSEYARCGVYGEILGGRYSEYRLPTGTAAGTAGGGTAGGFAAGVSTGTLAGAICLPKFTT